MRRIRSDLADMDYADLSILRAASRALKRARVIRRQRRVARQLADELIGWPPSLRQKKIWRARSRYRSRPLIEELVERCRKLAHADPTEALRIGNVALEILRWTPEQSIEIGGAVSWNDLSCLALAQVANVHRVLGANQRAGECFDEAYVALAKGSGDPEIRARLYSLHASLLKDTRQVAAAMRRLRRAARLFHLLGDTHEYARTLLKRAGLLLEKGDPHVAIPLQLEGLRKIDEERDLSVTYAAFCCLAEMYRQTGAFDDALRLLRDAEEEWERCPIALQCRTYGRWVRGKVERDLGKQVEAERFLRLAMDGYRGAQDSFDAGLVGLDLMKLYAAQGRLEELAELARPTLEALHSQDLAPEALAALRLLARAVELRQVESQLLDRVAADVRAHRRPRRV